MKEARKLGMLKIKYHFNFHYNEVFSLDIKISFNRGYIHEISSD